jgi:uncharacterized protein (UPF0147 family)
MGHQFVKTVYAKGKLYLYLAEEFSVNRKTIQKMIRRITEEEARQLGWKGRSKSLRAYSALSTVLQIPLSERAANRPHQETLLIRVWAEAGNPKTIISPQQVSFEGGQIAAARFKLPIPAAALRPIVFIAVDSTCMRVGADQPVQSQDIERNKAEPNGISENSTRTETSQKSHLADQTATCHCEA